MRFNHKDMRHVLYILMLLACSYCAYGQESFDSTYIKGKYEPLDMVTIKRVKNPKKLVKKIMERLHQDLMTKHGNRKYKIEAVFCADSFPPYSASCIYPVESDNGLEIQQHNVLDDFCCMGVENLSRKDSLSIKSELRQLLYFSPAHLSNIYSSGKYPPSPFVSYNETIRWYKTEAYEMGSKANSEYRLELVKRKKRRLYRANDREIWHGDNTDTVFFDCETLRIKRFKAEFRRKELSNYRTSFQVEYGEENGSPVLNQIYYEWSDNQRKEKAKVTIQAQ